MGEQEGYSYGAPHEHSAREGMHHANIFEATEAQRLVRLHTLWGLSTKPDQLAAKIVSDTTTISENYTERTRYSIVQRQIRRILKDPNNQELSLADDDTDGQRLQAVIEALDDKSEAQIKAALIVLRDLHVVTLRHGDVDSKLWIDLSRKLLVEFDIVDLETEDEHGA